MGKKIFIMMLCLLLITFSQLNGISFLSPVKVEAATCDTPNFPKCTQDLTQPTWLTDTNNGFIVSRTGDDGFDLLKYSDGTQYPAGYYIEADEHSPPKSIRISAGENFAGGVFNLKSFKINTINKHNANDALSLTIQGYDQDGNPKGSPVTFKTIAFHEPIYDIPVNLEGIHSFVITVSVQYIATVQAGIWDVTFTNFTIDIPNNPPTVTNSAITTSNITASGVQLDWAKASDDLTAQGDLEYLVYQSSSNNIDTVSAIESNGTALGSGYAKDITSYNVTGLAANTSYYFNVIVKDTAGTKSAYTMQQVTTLTLNKPPTSSNGTVNVNEGQVYTLNTTSFTFSDEDAGDTLKQIQISAIPNSGQLFLDSNLNEQFDAAEAITNGMTVSKVDLDAGKLKYITDNGTASTFAFKVSDGMNDSGVYTMNLIVKARPNVTISSNKTSPTNSNPILITTVFSESVTGFTVNDIAVTNGIATSLTGSGTTYTAQISPIADGAVKIKIPEKVVANSSGAFNKASNELQIIYDATPPTDIALSNTTVQEKKPIGTTVGTLTATDSGSSPTFTYALQSGDTSFFTINGNVLKTSALFAYDTKNSYKITIRVTDEAGNTFDKDFIIQVTKNHAPTGTMTINNGLASTSTPNVTLTMMATDTEGEAIEMRFSNDGITWSGWEPNISTKSWTLSNGDGNKTVYMQLKDTAGNLSTVFSDTIVLDTTPPVITGVANSGVYNTDVTISFNEGTATLNGAPFTSGTIVKSTGNYTLVVTDSAGNTTTVTFVIDKVLPQAVEVTIKSTNLDSTKAKIGDTITLAMKTDKTIQTPSVTIAGKTATVSGASTNWQATYVIAHGDLEGVAPFTINFKDVLGNAATEVTDVTDGSFVTVDGVKPTVKKITMVSNNANPTVAKVNDGIIIDFETSEAIQTPNVTILGQTANVSDKGDGDAKTWQASYTLKSVDAEGPIPFTMDYQDLAGNDGLQVTDVSSGTIVVFDKKAPEITTYFPAHQATNVQPTDNLVLTFNEKVLPVTNKNIVIRNASTNQIVETIDVTHTSVSIANQSVTINPTKDLNNNTAYSIQIDAGAFIDLAGNVYDGITNNTTWHFATSALPTYTVLYDSNGADGGKVPIDSKRYKTQETITVLNHGNLSKAGFSFVAWNTKADGKGVSYKAGQTLQMGKGNLVLYAVWSANSVPGDGGSSTSSPDPVVPSNQVMVNVVDPRMPNEVLLQTVLTRVFSNGSFQDSVNFTVANANDFLRKLANQEDKKSRLVIPDMAQPASETKVILAREAAKRLLEGKSYFGIDMTMVKIDVPFTSMTDFNEDIYFRIIPIKDALRQKAIEDRAKQAEIVLQQSHGANVKVVGQSISIDTNLQNRPVTVLLPLPANLTAAQQEQLMVYVEHSNGSAEIIRGRIVEFAKGQTAIAFDVQHFSTFTLLYVEQAQEEPEKEPTEADSSFTSYIHGYADGTFRPNAYVTRAQMAAMLARNLSDNNVPEASNLYYADTADSWAKNDIEYVRTEGIMQGRQNHSFGPNDVMTRAQMAVIAARWIDKQCAEGTTDTYCEITANGKTYSDVASTHWAAKEIHRISSMGIMVGSGNGQFRPEEKLTRAQAVKVLNRIFNRPVATEGTEQIFKDIPRDHWAFYEIQAAATNETK